jgi:hypothetical protein
MNSLWGRSVLNPGLVRARNFCRHSVPMILWFRRDAFFILLYSIFQVRAASISDASLPIYSYIDVPRTLILPYSTTHFLERGNLMLKNETRSLTSSSSTFGWKCFIFHYFTGQTRVNPRKLYEQT